MNNENDKGCEALSAISENVKTDPAGFVWSDFVQIIDVKSKNASAEARVKTRRVCKELRSDEGFNLKIHARP